jgi:hypothetical protein
MPKLKVVPLFTLIIAVLLVACSSGKTGSPGSTATLTPPAGTAVQVQVKLDFAGASTPQPAVAKTVRLPTGSTAWDAITAAVGPENVKFTDYGGSLGVFINGFYGVVPAGNAYWEFGVNGKSSDVGVSQYIVQDRDVIEFHISS